MKFRHPMLAYVRPQSATHPGMSPTTLQWVKVAHIFGFVLWSSGLLSALFMLRAHAAIESNARAALIPLEKIIGIVMDAGATVAMAAGFALAFGTTPIAFKTGGWLHVKLTLVVLGVLSVHGMLRVKMRKYRNGDVTPLPTWLLPVLLIAIAGIVLLGAHPTLLRK
jgi:protoporphyrinogen IX oxidase